MNLENLQSKNKRKRSNRSGRGIAGFGGKTAGRGTKGQKSRSGYNLPRRFEGGQTPYTRRLPKVRGNKSLQEKPCIVNFDVLNANFKNGEKVTPKNLFNRGLIKGNCTKVKILSRGSLTKKITFNGCVFSHRAQDKIKKCLTK